MTDILMAVIVAFLLFIGILETKKERNEIRIVKKLLEDMEPFERKESDVKEKCLSSVEITRLQSRAEMLRFCYLCPLYQEKVQEDKQQKTPQERE